MARKNPKLTVVASPPSGSGSPPSGNEPVTKSPGSELWDAIMVERQLTNPGDLEMLRQACIMTDRAEDLAAQIERDGAIGRINGVPKSHPALRDEVAARSFVTRTLARLGVVGERELETERRKPGRPATGQFCGITAEQAEEWRRGKSDSKP